MMAGTDSIGYSAEKESVGGKEMCLVTRVKGNASASTVKIYYNRIASMTHI